MKKLVFAVALVFVGCPTPVGPPNPPPNIQANCSEICENLRKLDCEEGKPTADGASCEAVCENMPSSQTYRDCAATITVCSQLNKCPR